MLITINAILMTKSRKLAQFSKNISAINIIKLENAMEMVLLLSHS